MTTIPFEIKINVPEKEIAQLKQGDLFIISGDIWEMLELYRAMADLSEEVERNCGARGIAAYKAVSEMIARGKIVKRARQFDA